jgi:solute carrier family 25 carnitine/acylcarnitine transporter 20/29
MQNTEGSSVLTEVIKSDSFMETASSLYQRGGVSIFFDGISPKLIRAAINHSVTFYIYDLITTKLLQ